MQSIENLHLYLFLVSFIGVLIVTPVAIRFAHKQDIVDKPGLHKTHSEVTPLLGGLAAGTAAIIFLAMAALSVLDGGRPNILSVQLIGAGACLGFLVFNFHPAKIFMGDAGSMLLGLIMATTQAGGHRPGVTQAGGQVLQCNIFRQID